MNTTKFKHWSTSLKSGKKRPVYLLIPEIISDDIDNGVLKPRERLPTVRDMAKFLSLDYTTVARAYKEARRQGLIESNPRSGSFIKGNMRALKLRGGSNFEMTMNLPPEPDSNKLINKLNNGFKELSDKHDIHAMFRYQDFGGSDNAKQAGLELLSSINRKQINCSFVQESIVRLLV